jgi:thiol-disulfide isomerase/thioredoxin
MKRHVLAALGIVIAFASPATAGPPQNFVLHDEPALLQDFPFEDGEGHVQRLSDFRGKVVLLNIWATWCLPCRKEMPTLDRLQASLGGPDFEVVALSIDRGGPDVVRKFFADIGIENLAIHMNPSDEAAFTLAVAGLPTTLLIDREGRELGRLVGPAEWDAPDMIEFFKPIISSRTGATTAPQ